MLKRACIIFIIYILSYYGLECLDLDEVELINRITRHGVGLIWSRDPSLLRILPLQVPGSNLCSLQLTGVPISQKRLKV